MNRRIPAMIVVDHAKGRVTVDGDELLPGHCIAQGPTVEVDEGLIARVDIGIYCDNVLVITKAGIASPTAEADAKRIVRKGLADVLEWLGEAA